jgi:hypothetical protein
MNAATVPAGLQYTAPIGDQPIPHSVNLVPGTGVPPGHVAGLADGPIEDLSPAEKRAAFAAELPPPRSAQPVEVAHGPAANVSSTTPYNGPGSTPHMQSIQAKADELRERAAAKLAGAGHPAFSSAKQANIVVGPDGTEVSAGDATVVAGGPGGVQTQNEADVDALLAQFKTKAAIQEAGRRIGLTNLSRTRANLAKDMVAHPAWPSLRAALLPHDRNDAGAVLTPEEAAAEGETFSATVSNAPGPVPPDPEPQYTVSGPIQHATVGGQPVPHTDNPFAQAAPVAPAESLEDQLLRRIGAATSPRDLEQIWNDANDGGIGWPARLHQAATIKHGSFTN